MPAKIKFRHVDQEVMIGVDGCQEKGNNQVVS